MELSKLRDVRTDLLLLDGRERELVEAKLLATELSGFSRSRLRCGKLGNAMNVFAQP
jgi:hypothetical protein